MNAGAATLGAQQVRSAAGAPLRAAIVLNDVSSTEADGLSVKLASRDAFRQAGLRYDPALDKVSVRVTPLAAGGGNGGGTYLVHVDSSEPVNASYLDMLFVFEWRTGRQASAYTLSAVPAQAANGPQAVVPAAVPGNRARNNTNAEVPAGSLSEGESIAGAGNLPDSHVVRRGDTLSTVAREFTGGEGGGTLAQMMTALFQSNRGAFIGGDPNRLRNGASLNRPSDAQVQNVSPTQARQFVSQAKEQFEAYRARLAESTAQQAAPAEGGRSAQGTIEAGKAPEAAAPATRDELKLSRPGKGRAAGAAGDSEAENIARGKAQTEAQGRVNELQKNVADLQKLLAMKNQAAAKLEEQAATASGALAQDKQEGGKAANGTTSAGAAATAGAAAAKAAQAVNPAGAQAASGAAAEQAASVAASETASAVDASAAYASSVAAASAAVASAPEAAASSAAAPVAASAPKAADAGTTWNPVRDNPYAVAGAGAFVVLLGLWWLMRRRRKADKADETPPEPTAPYDPYEDTSAHEASETAQVAKSRLSRRDEALGVAGAAEVGGVALATGAAGAAALYAAQQAEADEHLHPVAEEVEPAGRGDVAVEPAHDEAFALAAEDDVAQASEAEEHLHPAAEVSAPEEPSTADWDKAFSEAAGGKDLAADVAVDPFEAAQAEAAASAHAPEAVAAADDWSDEPTVESPVAEVAPAAGGGVAGMLGDLDLGIPGQSSDVGSIPDAALPSLQLGKVGSVAFKMAPEGDPAHAQAAEAADVDPFDGEPTDADFEAAAAAFEPPAAEPAKRSYVETTHEAPSLKPMSFDLGGFSLDLKGDDGAPARVTVPATTGVETRVEHVEPPQPAPTSAYAPRAAAPVAVASAPSVAIVQADEVPAISQAWEAAGQVASASPEADVPELDDAFELTDAIEPSVVESADDVFAQATAAAPAPAAAESTDDVFAQAAAAAHAPAAPAESADDVFAQAAAAAHAPAAAESTDDVFAQAAAEAHVPAAPAESADDVFAQAAAAAHTPATPAELTDDVFAQAAAAHTPEAAEAPAADAVPSEFATKLELATAYEAIGDDDGARELLEEVIAGGDATLQSVARHRLASLGK